ncbi:MAG: cellulase family glycosylhydrolase [Gordonia polyisoprenivorans]|nr:cellulase family glycosylhydrolase [Gordonia polyisoprenivorans]
MRASWIGGSTRAGSPTYQLFIDGRAGPTAVGLSATITALEAGSHAISIASVDADGSTSRRTPESVVTVGDGVALELPLILEAVPAASRIQFRWTFDRSYDGPAPDSYLLRRQGLARPVATTARTADSPADTWCLAGSAAPNVTAEYYVEAVDATGATIGRSGNSVRAASYYRSWPRSYPSPGTLDGVAVAGTTVSWTGQSQSDVNVFVDGRFVAQARSPQTSVQLPSGPVEQTLTLQHVSPWGVTTTQETGRRVSIGTTTRSGFTTRAGRIYDANGKPFVPVGVNVSGPDFFWSETLVGTADDARDDWRMTAVRVGCGFRDWGAVSGAQGHLFFTNNDLDRIVDEYTGAGIVVILAQFNKALTDADATDGGRLLSTRTGSAPDGTGRSVEDATTDWWIEVARRYRDNPLVWLNPINEPQRDIDGLADQYSRMLTRLRSVAPLTPLVLDAANFANDIPNDADIGDGPIREVDSFVLRHGPPLVEQFGEPRGYGPVIFSIHVYSRWPRDYATNTRISDEKLAARMRAYVRDVRSRGLAILVGETGVEDWAREYDSASVRVGLYEQGRSNGTTTGVWPEQEVGVIAWHASPVSGMSIARGRSWSSVTDISEAAPPPDAGAGIWDYGHRIRP